MNIAAVLNLAVSLLTLVTVVFVAGRFYQRVEALEKDVAKLRSEFDESPCNGSCPALGEFASVHAEISAVRSEMKGELRGLREVFSLMTAELSKLSVRLDGHVDRRSM